MAKMSSKINSEWLEVLKDEFEQSYFIELNNFIDKERESFSVFPPEQKIFSAFNLTPFSLVKVVIIGQDPYHGKGQANGLCFSVADSIKTPPSLKNIFKELKDDLQIPMPSGGNLERWAQQGVLMLNATLTVRENHAGSHQQKGWEKFTDAVIKNISEKKEGIIFLLWGNYAKNKASIIDTEKHHLLLAPHPSPLARGGFFGCKHFSKTNQLLKAQGKKEIDWRTEIKNELF
jgi:uracil-DNA glycosylase